MEVFEWDVFSAVEAAMENLNLPKVLADQVSLEGVEFIPDARRYSVKISLRAMPFSLSSTLLLYEGELKANEGWIDLAEEGILDTLEAFYLTIRDGKSFFFTHRTELLEALEQTVPSLHQAPDLANRDTLPETPPIAESLG